MEKEPEVRICKNKDCQKVLPAGYKYDECEACRNKKADGVKRALSYIGSGILAIGGILFFGGKGIKK